ncbi:MAG: serine/threonine protein kinase, partial [Gemmatimonadetes bacterium]|nr:serine/threonine protein kinase [Gemmatimonadota bacterium]
MPSLLERLNDALTPDFHVERELARGGMGAVFLAWDTNLEVPVAIKVLLPEMATATATERFLREARILAALRHSHIVPVHRNGEADGLYYYVMDYMEGDTLADRLDHDGALSKAETVKLGRDMLDALETVHKAGVVHRDIKPSNIFLQGRSAVLVDFGIARPPVDQSDPITAVGGRIGTLPYMPPEQEMGDEVTPQTDICALGMVLYEALTKRQWRKKKEPYPSNPRKEDWTGVPWSRVLILVPWNVVSILARALAYSPHDRWPNAQTFRRRLWATRLWGPRMRAARDVAVVATLVAAVAVVITLAVVKNQGSPLLPPEGSLTIRLRPFQQTGDIAPPWLADSLAQRLERSLRLISEFRVLAPDTLPDFQAAVELQGVVSSEDSTVSWQVWSESWGKGLRRLAQFTAGDWKIVADSVSNRTIRELWSDESPLGRWLPREALPATPQGFDEWLRAERLLNGGHWEAARVAFDGAVAIDSGCFLCSWGIAEVDRWLFRRPIESMHRQRVLDNYHLFPPHFRRLIRARLELTDRLDTLRLATDEWGEYYYAWWLRGEEEYNRGPLAGLLRAEAAISLERAAELRPEFAPIWWDLAFIYIAEGHAADASRALRSMPEPLDPFSMVVTTLLGIAYAYRFGDERAATQDLRQVLDHPEFSRDPRLASLPRWMPYFGAIDGAIRAGGVFADLSNRPNLRRSGLIGQLFGLFAMGQMDAARERARVYQR